MAEHHGITDGEVPLLQHANSTAFHHRASAAITAYFTLLWQWVVMIFTAYATFLRQWPIIFFVELLIMIIAFIFGWFFIIPLTPAFTLHSISTSAPSILNTTTAGENVFTTNLGVLLHVDHSNPIGSRIHDDDSLHASLFHRQQNISTFFLPRQQELKQSAAATAIEALFPNVSLMVDEWSTIMDRGFPSSSCGYVYLDLWFNASARFTPFAVKDKLEGHCGEVKVQLCYSYSSTVVHPFHGSCRVQSDVVSKIQPIVVDMCILLAVLYLGIHLPMAYYIWCSPYFRS